MTAETTNRFDPTNESAPPLAGNWQFSKNQSSCSELTHTLDTKPNQWTDSIRKVEPEQPLLVELNDLRKSGESIIFEKRQPKRIKILQNKKRRIRKANFSTKSSPHP